MSKISICFLLLVFHIQNSSALETVLFGGGGDPSGNSTIFDGSLKKLAQAKDGVGLNIKASFDGGHQETEDIIKKSLNIGNQDFTPDNFEKIIKEYAQKIKSGQIKSGEKLLIIVDSHGQAEPYETDAAKNTTHLVDMARHGKTVGARHSSMDQLKELSKLALEYKINLGIIDFSCHSGNSLPLANENTCVVTASSPDLYGYDEFSNAFYDNMKKGDSLEDVFLKARSESNAPSFPMISTDSGRELNQTLYPLIHPYLLSLGGIANKYTPYMENIFASGVESICKREDEFKVLLKEVEDFEKVNGILKNKYSGEESLLKELKSYKTIQDKYLELMKTLNYGLLKSEEKFYPNDKNKKVFEKVTWWNALSLEADAGSYFEELIKKGDTPEMKKDYQQSLRKIQYSLKLKEKILTEHPELREAATIPQKMVKQSEEINTEANSISQIGNEVYAKKYNELKSTAKKNACTNFVF